MGPQSEDEILDENPRHAYVIGMLSPQVDDDGSAGKNNEQEVDTDIAYARMARIIQSEKMTIMNR